MKNRLFIIVTMLLALLFSLTGYSAQNPSLSNPAGATTTPQSYISSSVVDTSNPIDMNGNQIITGNVRRGMHFRGNVPYNSPSSFSATLGSSSLSSFMRDSAGAEDIGGTRSTSAVGSSPGTNYRSYYLPSSTVTTMSQGRSGIAATGNTTINNGSHYASSPQTPENQPAVSSWNTSERSPALWQLYNPSLAGTQNNTLRHPRSVSSSPHLNQQQSQDQFGQYQRDDAAIYQLYKQQTQTNPNTTENLRNTSQYIENQTTVTPPQTQQSLQSSQQTAVLGNPYAEQINQRQQSLNQPRYGTQDSSITTGESAPANMSQYVPPQRGFETLTTGEFDTTRNQTSFSSYSPGTFNRSVPDSVNTAYRPNTGSDPTSMQQYQEQTNRYSTTPDTGTKESLAQIQRQLDDLIRSIDNRLQTSTVDTSHSGTAGHEITDRPRTGTSYSTGQTNLQMSGQTDSSRKYALTGLSNVSRNFQESPSAFADIKQLSQAEISAGESRIKSRYPDYESYSQTKYNQLYRAAEGHLNIGRFYQAADAFSLAAIYKPEDPLCYAGRGHALFAAGEYVSSALHLIRAIELDPEYLQTHIDLAELMGGTDKLDSKIADLSKWLQKSDAPGLGFLLGYVYYHTGRLSEAKQVMELVTQEMPNSKAAMALKMTIDFKLTIHK
jgi:tetratricopeptide (TPR) repeat protein